MKNTSRMRLRCEQRQTRDNGRVGGVRAHALVCLARNGALAETGEWYR
jgi:hypothetical protein